MLDQKAEHHHLGKEMRPTIINRRFRYVDINATGILVAINIAVFCLTEFLFPRLTYTLALVPSSIYYGHSWWQFVTYMFVHSGYSHLLFNMLSLYIFGRAVEHRVGSKEFLLYYLLTGTLCGVASYIVYYIANTNVVLLGASGAIYALLILFSDPLLGALSEGCRLCVWNNTCASSSPDSPLLRHRADGKHHKL